MRRSIEVATPGLLAAAIAVTLLMQIDASPVPAIMAALGAAIPVSMLYAILTYDESTP
ncbi:hypothetical protein JCM18237_04970 [Halorubrum luteum]